MLSVNDSTYLIHIQSNNDNAYVIIMNYFSSEIVGVPAAVVPASSNKVLQFESSSVVNVVQEEEDEEKEQEEHEDHNFEEEEIEMKVSEQKKSKNKVPPVRIELTTFRL